MATTPVLFSEKFDVSSNDNYGDFIGRIRTKLSKRHFCHNRPVLPPVVSNVPPTLWFHVELRTNTSALKLITRADNLYLEGFQSSDGTWWQLTRGLIDGATYVGFGGSYRDLVGDSDYLTDITLGPQKMTQAINTLARLAARTPADLGSGAAQQGAKDAVAALLLMVHEATRFLTVSNQVAGFMHPRAANKKGTITVQMKNQVNGWQNLSAALLSTEARPPTKFTPFNDMGVATVEQAVATVGILLFVEVPGGMTAKKALELYYGN